MTVLMNPKYIAARNALKAARDKHTISKRALEQTLEEMERTSSMPVEALKNHIWNVYRENEPQRVEYCIDNALSFAKRNTINDENGMEFWLGRAQKHSEMPLARSVIDHVHQEYQKSEPRRKYEALRTALRSARSNTINDENAMELWLGFAQEHSSMPLAQSVIDHVHQEYQIYEPLRALEAIKTALKYAKKGDIGDITNMNFWLRAAQEHSDTPIPQPIIDFVHQEYLKHEPLRMYKELENALKKGEDVLVVLLL